MASTKNELNIFKLNRIKYQELWNDAVAWVKKTYNVAEQQFTMASPFAQLLSVILHLGRMILYYIEDSITGLNIKTAYRPDQIKGLAQLTGHNAGRAISAHGGIRLYFKDTGDMNINGKVCTIPNKTKVLSKRNGASYILMLNQDFANITCQAGNFIEGNLVQGTRKMQKATGIGAPLQSFNFAERNYGEIEEYYIGVYVNSERWQIVKSLTDLGFNQKGCVVRTGMTGGVDVFFGNGDMGAIPPSGADITLEYISSDGVVGNMTKEFANTGDVAWELKGVGHMADGSQISLEDNFYITCETDIIFGSQAEDTTLTQLLAPHTSRSFVLANEINYKYFFQRMNQFSTIEIVKGYSSKEANLTATLQYDKLSNEYSSLFDIWQNAVATDGENAPSTKELYTQVQNKLDAMRSVQQTIEDTDMPDNTVYILLLPDVSKRISSATNYFTCDESLFVLTEDEQQAILRTIDESGQRIITIENRFLQPKIARFAVNAQVKMWEGYNERSVYADCMNTLSEYFLKNKRKDIIPVSDIVALLEGVNGIDSVKVWFDGDKENENVYGEAGFYGIDEYGDIVLTRTYTNSIGNAKLVRDVLPLVRGGFTSSKGIEYSSEQSFDYNSAFNLNVVARTKNTNLSLETSIPITN